MNEKILNVFSGKCIELIQEWKKDNWFKPLDIQKGCIIDHIVTYDDAAELYHQLWDGASDDDPEILKELTKLENHLYELNTEENI